MVTPLIFSFLALITLALLAEPLTGCVGRAHVCSLLTLSPPGGTLVPAPKHGASLRIQRHVLRGPPATYSRYEQREITHSHICPRY